MTRLGDYEARAWTAPRGRLEMTEHGRGYSTGVFINRLGVVRVCQFTTVTALYLVRGGIEYQRCWDRRWGRKTISRLAREYLEDMLT